MFRFDEGLKVYLRRDPVDFRMGINGLSILVEQAMRLNPMTSALFVFGNRRRDRIKILGWGGITLSAEQLHWLLDGIDLAVIQKHPQRYYARMS
ncbi:IS66 family insertion sequence element accessory protein TnpB [Burkholderia vietnamiensis]|uniref:IS66 Orf2 family protein n=3 Tax=Burkholderia vietnamiensis TaxID=60552 RepID=A4JRZ9_BURVG|nr:IS66 family insertion sequence element accessory protein TnpB [Burkholderia vietnamiensis]ABO59052.1 IS66 Orf2 family protein [Burkholderia vietnamiensis G4]AOK02194.1 transposase [Burkholderia vietnamiensis]MCA8395645.1 IS66 family insertion sequence element accessory protein TnpB [Burkholderia vietnamiensis]MCB4347817.1 IS66 family insertion sequence element accessory protein TnpB [Burkholderia vietnamiensis]QTK88760.1 IS66 family insertion sequence element accessory protein TnpB [Burkhol